MKKILFASTALVAFAGAAAADVTLTGNAELGVFSADSLVDNGDELNSDNNFSFATDIDVTFTMTGETDNGLVFGASVDLDSDDNAFALDEAGDDVTIFISGAFGRITAGDTDGALDFALTEVAFNAGSLNDDETVHFGFNGNSGLDGLFDGQVVRYDFSQGNFAIAVSAEIDDANGDDNDDVLGIGATYDLDFGGTIIGLGAGYQTAEIDDVDLDTYGISANAAFGGGFTFGASYMEFNNHLPSVNGTVSTAVAGITGDIEQNGRVITDGDDTDHFGVGLGYSQGPISVNVNYGEFDSDTGVDLEGYGISVGYDLGGGAVVQLGYGHSSTDIDDVDGVDIDVDDVDTVSFGVRMNF